MILKVFVSEGADLLTSNLLLTRSTQINKKLLFLDVKEVFSALVRFEKLSKEVQDILECRIEAILDDIGHTLLCWLPEDEAATPDEFNIATEKVCQQEALHLSKYVYKMKYNTI